jgi:hypothetical protein
MTSKSNPPVLELVNSAKKSTAKKPGNTGGNGGSGSIKQQKFGDYVIKNGAFYQVKAVRSGPDNASFVEFPLCNFTCKITEEIVHDDGLLDSSFLRIEGRRADNVPLPLADVPAKSFYASMGNWPNEHWGTTPFIYPGAAKKDNLRAAIHLYSNLNGDVPRRVIYKYTGWKKLDDAWVYLTGSGAITANGLIDGVEVDLGSGHMSRYQLPAPLAGDELKQAVSEALLLMTICPGKPHIGAVLLAAVGRSPLGECHPIDFILFLHGLTGAKKSELAALALGFFGDFDARRLTSNFSDTDNSIEVKTFQAKDSIHVIDDFKPSVSQAEAAKLYAKAERLIRNTGNQGGRGRLTSEGQTKAAPYNRSLAIVTGEDLPKGQSLLGRSLVIELNRADVDVKTLTQLQKARDISKLSGLMSAYLQWLAPKLDHLKKDFSTYVKQYRDSAIRDGIAASHPRAPEIYANLVVGAEKFIDFMQDVGAISSEQANILNAEIETGLRQAFSEQAAYQIEQDEVERFIQLLRAAFSSGSCHIADRLNQGPPVSRPFAWGWRDAGVDVAGDKNFNPMGDCIGYHCEASGTAPAEVWLIQENAFKIAAQFARNQGDSLLLSAGSLWRRLEEKGLIVHADQDDRTGKRRSTTKRVVAGRRVRVMILSADFVESG